MKQNKPIKQKEIQWVHQELPEVLTVEREMVADSVAFEKTFSVKAHSIGDAMLAYKELREMIQNDTKPDVNE